ncbi:MAG: DUF885 domain-containing protein [Pseudomonadota bacterium]
MRRAHPVGWILTALTLACHHPLPAESALTTAPTFEQLSQDFLEEWLRRSPVAATYLGDHRYDGRWPDVSPEAEADELRWLRGVEAALTALPRDGLDPEDRVDADILAQQVEGAIFGIEALRGWERDPLSAVGTAGAGLDTLASREFAPAQVRAESLRQRLEGLPAFLAQAEARLQSPPELHTRTAMDQTAALAAWVGGPLLASFPEEQRPALAPAAQEAEQALREFATFLEADLLPRSTGDFRLGPDLWARKLGYDLDTRLTAEQIRARAWALLEATRADMVRDAIAIYPQLFPGEPLPAHGTEEQDTALVRRVLDRLAEEHADDDTIIAQAQASLERATRFVAEQGLVTLPDEPVQVIVMPEFKRGVAIAYCDAPGPLETVRETSYAIAPPPADWPEARRASFYREYNAAMLEELTIHEAMPGHFVQLAHAARFESPVRAMFSSGTFVEGWAIYTEWLMAQHGYGGPAVRLQREKMVLRLCINALIDHGIHAGGMTHDEALALMTGLGFQEEGEAEGKWKRGCLTSAQLTTYLVGMLEVMALRRAAEARDGAAFDERAFNDALLAHGSPPPRHLADLLGLQLAP